MTNNFLNYQARFNKNNSNPVQYNPNYYTYSNQPRIPNIPYHTQGYLPNSQNKITNNFMIVSDQKHPFQRRMGLSSTSRAMNPSLIKMENSESKFKLKYTTSPKNKLLSPTKTEVSLSAQSTCGFSTKTNKKRNDNMMNQYRPFYDNKPLMLNQNYFQPIKTPNFNKNYFQSTRENLFKNITPKLNPTEEKEILKKIMRIFLKMDTIRKKEVEIYKNKLIPFFNKLNINSHRMKYLQEFLQKFLMEEKITQQDIDSLNVAEKLVFMSFLVKKKYFDVDCFEFTPESILFFQDRMTSKRNEQEYKIILKKAFKTMIQAFNQEKGFYDSSKRHFYEEYFGDFAKTQSIPLEDLELENLFNEKGKAKKKKRKSKKNYAQILKTSPIFLKRLSEYLDNKFSVGPKVTGSKHDAIREIKKKVPDLVNKWKTRMLMEEDNPPHIQMAEFFGKFFTNKKVKLPWSIHEISRAVKSVKHLLQIN